MKVYISGKITGVSDYKERFEDAISEVLNGIDSNAEIVNPVSIGSKCLSGLWKDYMKLDIKEFIECDVIFMLKGWRKSKGARLEHKIAKSIGLSIIYQ